VKRPIAIDLFAGCGGMSLGLEAAGFDVVLAVEFDPIHALVHHFNFPYGITICQDISQLKSASLIDVLNSRGYHGEIDLIAGGPPCQGFSLIGKRNVNDPRNSLVFEYLRMICELKPKYLIFENVPGIASGEHQKFLQELVFEFEKIGYVINKPIQVLNSSFYGVPQKRKRLIIIGSRNDVKPIVYPQQTHFDPENIVPTEDEGSEANSDKKFTPLTTVGEAISDLALHAPYTKNDEGILSEKLDYSGLRKYFSVKPNGLFKLCHQRQIGDKIYGHLGSAHTLKSIERFKNTESGTVEKISRFYKLKKDGQCNTLRAGTASNKGAYTAPRPIHYHHPRCITIREAARLHTFPDWFQFHRTIWHGFREIGNAVTPFLAKALGDEIILSLGIDPTQLTTNILEEVDDSYLNFTMKEAASYWDVPDEIIPKRKKIACD